MSANTTVGTPGWNAWLAEIRRTGKLYGKAFAPPQVILDEREHLKGILVLHKDLEATEECGHKAHKGQVLFWFGDYAPAHSGGKPELWNGYDVKRNVYLIGPEDAEMLTQAELDVDREGTLRRLEMAASEIIP